MASLSWIAWGPMKYCAWPVRHVQSELAVGYASDPDAVTARFEHAASATQQPAT